MVRADSMSDDPSLDGSEDGDAADLSPRPTACLEDFLFDPIGMAGRGWRCAVGPLCVFQR